MSKSNHHVLVLLIHCNMYNAILGEWKTGEEKVRKEEENTWISGKEMSAVLTIPNQHHYFYK